MERRFVAYCSQIRQRMRNILLYICCLSVFYLTLVINEEKKSLKRTKMLVSLVFAILQKKLVSFYHVCVNIMRLCR